MNKADIRPGVLYLNFGGGDTIAVEAETETVSIERLSGTRHLSRGARGFIDRCVFPGFPNLTGEPLKRKVIRFLQDDIDGDAVEASVSCIEMHVEYLLGLPDEQKPKIIVYQVAACVFEGGLVESFVAVDGGFSDGAFFDLYESPGMSETLGGVAETEARLRMHGWAALGEEVGGGIEAKGGWHDEPWKGYPIGLKEMMLSVYHDDGTYSASQLVRRLSLEISEADVENPPDCLEKIAWVDRFMRDCAMDFTCHPDLWESSSGAIAELLRSVDNLLAALCRTGAVEARAYKSGTSDEDPTALAQRVNVYRSVSAALTGNIGEFRKRLSRATDDVEENVKRLLSLPSADELIEKEDTTRLGFYLPGQRYFTEPLAMLYGCAFHIGKSTHLAKAYHEYVGFLEKSGADPRGVRGKLLLDAERILGELLEAAVDEPYPEYPLDMSATGEVRRLLSENPGLPIVVFAGPEGVPGTYADISSVDLIEFLDCDAPYAVPSKVITSRQELETLVREECEALVRPDQRPDALGKRLEDLVEAEMAGYEPSWSKAIRINVAWKELCPEFAIYQCRNRSCRRPEIGPEPFGSCRAVDL